MTINARFSYARKIDGNVPAFVHKADQLTWYSDGMSEVQRRHGIESKEEELRSAVEFMLPHTSHSTSLVVSGHGWDVNVDFIDTSYGGNLWRLYSKMPDESSGKDQIDLRLFTTQVMPFLGDGNYGHRDHDRIYHFDHELTVVAHYRVPRERESLDVLLRPFRGPSKIISTLRRHDGVFQPDNLDPEKARKNFLR